MEKMKRNTPLLTVLMPIFNTEEYLSEAIESILNQTFSDFEFLIINDGSKDSSAKIVRKYKDKKIRFVNHRKHQGLVPVLNEGLTLAKGTYLARMDGDDISKPERLEKQVQFMNSHPNIDICGTWFEVFGNKFGKKVYTRPTNPAACKAVLLFTDPVCHASVIMRLKVIRKFNLKFDPSFKHLEDYEFFNRASDYVNFANLGEVLYQYRYHKKRTGSLYKNQQELQMRRVQKIYLTKLGIACSDNDLNLHWQLLTRSYKPTKTFLLKARSWLLKLVIANENSLRYDSKEFRKQIDKRWKIAYQAYSAQKMMTPEVNWQTKVKNVFKNMVAFLVWLINHTRYAKYLSFFRQKLVVSTIPSLEEQVL